MTLFPASRGVTKSKPAWTQDELARIRDAWTARVPHSELETLFPGRTKAAIVMMAARMGLDRGDPSDKYVSVHELMRISKMSQPTLMSIFDYAKKYDRAVRTHGKTPRVVYHQEDAEAAIIRWIDLMSLRQYAEYIGKPYTTIQSWMRRIAFEFRPEVEIGHRRLHPLDWSKLFTGEMAGLGLMFYNPEEAAEKK